MGSCGNSCQQIISSVKFKEDSVMAKAIYRVYRPATFADLVGQEHVSTTIQHQYAAGRLAHAYLFTGPRGVGKTTTARLIAKLANCEQPDHNEPCNACASCQQILSGSALDVYEIDAASNTDVEHVRENIIKSVRFAPSQLKKKIFIIDEVHMLSTSAFNALLKTLEEPPDHVLFVLATTEIHKVPETIVSRCQRFDFRRIPAELMIERLKGIVQQEQINVDVDVLEQIVKHSGGCARDAESLLGQILALGDEHISMKEASLVLPATTNVLVETFLEHLFAKDTTSCVNDINAFLEQGVDIKTFLDDVISQLREQLFEDESGFVRQAILSFLEARSQIRTEHLPQLPIELAIMDLCPISVKRESVDAIPRTQTPTSVSTQTPTFDVQSDTKVPTIDPQRIEVPIAIDPVPVETSVFDSVPVISLEDVREKWPQVFEQIKACNASLPLMMQSCEVCDVAGDRIELGFGYALYVDTVNKDKNRTLIEDVFEKVLGTRLKVKAIVKKPEIDETISDLIGQFGGSEI